MAEKRPCGRARAAAEGRAAKLGLGEGGGGAVMGVWGGGEGRWGGLKGRLMGRLMGRWGG